MRNSFLKRTLGIMMSALLSAAMLTACGQVENNSGNSEVQSENADSVQQSETSGGDDTALPEEQQAAEDGKAGDASTENTTEETASETEASENAAPEEHDDYELVWADEFDGDSLNTADWNVETHEPGWVNAELQRYTALDEGNIEVSDGTLKIIPHIETEESEEKITSGRITTQNKHDFTYGRFEARAKVPTGKGYLPAFWLMATDEGLYGQWPKCGEIDIMEVMGQDTGKSYHTIHYGYSSGNGHKVQYHYGLSRWS